MDGERVLINDTSAGGLKAYRSRTGTPTNVDTGGGDGSISSVALTDGSVVIEYTGTLKSATSVTAHTAMLQVPVRHTLWPQQRLLSSISLNRDLGILKYPNDTPGGSNHPAFFLV